jgi:hypothetical protein
MRKGYLLLCLLLAACVTAVAGEPKTSIQVRGLGWGIFPTPIVLHDGDYWGGEIYLTLNGQELLKGVWSGQDGESSWDGPDEMYGSGRNGIYTYAFNPLGDGTYKDTFTVHIALATFPIPNGAMGFGTYGGIHKIVSGTGRFKHAKGWLQVTGPWFDSGTAGATDFYARFAPEYCGYIDGVAPAN